uniref:Uncharacterized protein n=1 Tax=Arundo donax TaxID=35708 RepID=A0A0A9D385_ARUDO
MAESRALSAQWRASVLAPS